MIEKKDKEILLSYLYRTLPIMVLLYLYFNTYRIHSLIINILWVTIIISGWVTIYTWIKTKKIQEFKPFIKSFIKTFLFVAFMMFGFKWLGIIGGVFGFILGMVLLAAFQIFKSWDFFKESIYRIESIIWGKPLHEYKGKKRPKVKIGLGKKENGRKENN